MKNVIISFIVLKICLGAVLLFAMQENKNEMTVAASSAHLKWGPAPETLPPGAQMALLHGNPSESEAYGVRLKFPANYRIPPHWHPQDENVSVISGTFNLGMGEKFDQSKVTKFVPGGFFSVPKETGHFAWTVEPVELQLNGIGPFKIIYYDQADNPQPKKS